MTSFRKIALAASVATVLFLTGCSGAGDSDGGFGFSKKGETFYSESLINSSSTGTTLEGATLEDKNSGWTIRELEADEVPKDSSGPNSIKLLDGKLYLEAGGSGTAECRSNFDEIQYDSDKATLSLVHQAGDKFVGECTEDYRETYFELTPGDGSTLDKLEAVDIYEQKYSPVEGDESIFDIQTSRTFTYVKEDWK